MEDSGIVALYWARDERALAETAEKYGGYCTSISYNIVRNRQDAEECVNDTYVHAWNAMPPQRPVLLGAFLAKITRNLSLNRYRNSRTQRRGGGRTAVLLEELEDCAVGDPERQLEAAELSRLLDLFLRNLPRKDACIFLRRYWYMDSLENVAQRYHIPLNSVKSSLHRSRKKLRAYLEQEGVFL